MPLVLLDPLKRLALTRSGHVYSLADPPGMNSDALYVWGLWKRLNSVPDGIEVTQEARTSRDGRHAFLVTLGGVSVTCTAARGPSKRCQPCT